MKLGERRLDVQILEVRQDGFGADSHALPGCFCFALMFLLFFPVFIVLCIFCFCILLSSFKIRGSPVLPVFNKLPAGELSDQGDSILLLHTQNPKEIFEQLVLVNSHVLSVRKY